MNPSYDCGRGYGDAQIMEVESGTEKQMHTHDHSEMSLVMSGEFALVPGAERFLRVLYDAILDQLAASDVKTTNT